LKASVAERGWALIYVPDDQPSIHYTVGLTERDLPELILFGCDETLGADLLNDLADRLTHGQTFADGEPIWELTEDAVRLELHRTTMQAPVGCAFLLYGAGIRVRQLVLPDKAGRMPWHSSANDAFAQRLLFEPPL
jgi:hypothetical protein